MEFLGVDLAAVQSTLLTAVTLLSAGLLVALMVIDRRRRFGPRPIVILEPAPTPEQLPSAVGGPRWRPPRVSPTRAPPVGVARRYVDRPSVE